MYKKTNTPRWQLLTTVSAAALLGSINGAIADDGYKPVLWLEMGGQLERLQDSTEPFAPAFVSDLITNPFTSPIKLQAPPRYSIGEEARISFSPEDSKWIFSAGLRYGRANRSGIKHQETAPGSLHDIISVPAVHFYVHGTAPAAAKRFSTTVSQTHDASLVLDFEAGKDVGLGMFGAQGSSTLNAGVRIAQFTSRSSVKLDADPDFTVTYKYATKFFGLPAYVKIPNETWNLYAARMNASRSFKGVGPSLRWDASTALAGNSDSGSVTFDWGLNAALLFGRQKMRAHHETTGRHGSLFHTNTLPINYQTAHDAQRTRSVTVPNVGGFAGMSLRYPNAKLSLGYRADFFLGAIDGGIDTRKNENRGFFGPFASISIGLGD